MRHLERLNSQLQQFVYTASHDLQEPLRTISNMTTLLERRLVNIDDESKSYMRLTVAATQRMQNLLHDLLDYSRVDHSNKQCEHTESASALHSAISNLKADIERTACKITYDELPKVFVIPSQLVQLFQNFLSNSIKYKSSAPPCIHISAKHIGNEWVFSIRDNGIGFESKYYEKVFEIFKRLHSHDAYPGTGVGLAVCKKIVEGFDGRIWVESQPGVGSTFYFSIPLS